MNKTAWVFPGQGSQKVGMEAELIEQEKAQKKLALAEEILGWSVIEKCQGDEETLSRTLYTQPCLYTIEAIFSDLLKDQGKKPDIVAGHSLGEYVALYAAGVFSFEEGLKLVKYRGELMEQASGGKMVALLRFDRAALNSSLEDKNDVVLANNNNSQQVVISGTPEAVDQLVEEVKAKRALPLKVSGAFHSPLMTQASEAFQKLLEETSFNPAEIPVLSNVEPIETKDPETLKSRLVKQMTGSVQWLETMEQMLKTGVTQIIEIGPGQVLSGLFKKDYPIIQRSHILEELK